MHLGRRWGMGKVAERGKGSGAFEVVWVGEAVPGVLKLHLAVGSSGPYPLDA